MSTDKFGRHLYGHRDSEDIVFQIVDDSQLTYETVIPIFGSNTDTAGNFRLLFPKIDNFPFPLTSATVTRVELYPSGVQIVVNGKNYNTSDLVGVTLKKGDLLHFTFTPKTQVFFGCYLYLKVPFLLRENGISR